MYFRFYSFWRFYFWEKFLKTWWITNSWRNLFIIFTSFSFFGFSLIYLPVLVLIFLLFCLVLVLLLHLLHPLLFLLIHFPLYHYSSQSVSNLTCVGWTLYYKEYNFGLKLWWTVWTAFRIYNKRIWVPLTFNLGPHKYQLLYIRLETQYL